MPNTLYRRAPLGVLARLRSGENTSGDSFSKDDSLPTPVYGANGVIGSTSLEPNIQRESILIGRVGACGEINVAPPSSFASDNVLVVDLNEQAHRGWMYYVLLSSKLKDLNTSTAQPLITPSKIRQVRVPFPSMMDQQRIADYLDRETAKIDAAVADLDRYVELLNVKLESTAREIFTTLSEERQLIQTKFLVDITTGSGDTQDAQEDGEYPFYVRSDTIQRSGDYEFDCDAVLTSGDGAGVGKIFHLASGKFKAHQRVYVMHNFRRISPEYFYWMFKSAFPDVIRYGGAKSTVDSVRMPMIANLKLPVPDNSTQEEISGRLANLHEEVGSLISESTKLRDLLLKRRSVLITEVVTGRKQV
ncbi:restriction endonuclease subunit S [Micrococcoides hystricis]|uniref:Restriction endonuclease subunit S n=1 Tax=Micrococcoides hystricis TaxID=1572761 RepID=A0ABV6PBH8_9MICC